MAKSGFLRFVYNNNPFYLISACVLLYGLNTSLPAGTEEELVWILAPIFSAYTLLMALTAFLIVRLGKVWDDARTILLVVALMYFAISVSFDQLCVTYPKLATIVLSLGLVFCVVTTELTIFGLKIKLPACFRIPLHLLVAVIFGFPLAFAAMGSFKLNHDAHWILLSFPVIAGAAILTLIPAARAGRKAVAKNGSPWVWPYYPWSLFVLIVVGLCGRCALLSIAFEPSKGLDSVFDAYMLVPIFLAVLVVLLEIAIREKRSSAQQVFLALALLAIPMSMTWNPSSIQLAFLGEVILTAGSPLWLTSIGLVIFYCAAWLRNIDPRAVWMSLSFFVTAICSPTENEILSSHVSIWPIFCLSIIMFLIGLRAFHSKRFLASSIYASIGLGIFVFQHGQPALSPVIGGDALLMGMLMIGVANHDALARRINMGAAALMLILAFAILVLDATGVVAREFVVIQMIALIAVGACSFNVRRDVFTMLSVAGVVIQASFYTSCLIGMNYLEQPIVRYLMIAILCFLLGALISALKAGLSKLLYRRLLRTVVLVRSRIAAEF